MSAAEVLAQHRYYPAQGGYRCTATGCDWRGEQIDGEWAAHQLDALKATGYMFTPEDARLMRLAIDWIASELRDQKIPPGEFIGTRTFLNEMITRFDQYTALVGSETPWVREEKR
ncbi:MAG: hypothetical protein PGN30_10300 [Mycolicibacterium neoaurum]|uniref:hypothetical protein n=1 Tax=Mycolicibacterium neoaurum TaxID=1795 RepID=UPI002FF61498